MVFSVFTKLCSRHNDLIPELIFRGPDEKPAPSAAARPAPRPCLSLDGLVLDVSSVGSDAGPLHLAAPTQDDTPGSHVGRVSGLRQSHWSPLSPERVSHSWFAFIR